MLISSVAPVVRSKPQASQAGMQQAPVVGNPSPAVKVGHTETAPIATYDHGQLTIVAENVRLADVMEALHHVMGAEIDIPPRASDDRIWARLGPGPARKILSDLLSNTDLDYVIQGSVKDASGIQSVTLTVRGEDTPGKSGLPTESAERTGVRRPPGYRSDAAVPTEQEEVPLPPDAAAATAEATPAAPTAAPADSQPNPQSAGVAEQSPAANPVVAHPSPPATMSSEQIVQQLTNMYQQRKQLQQTQSSSTPN
jgi:hypothetical protein